MKHLVLVLALAGCSVERGVRLTCKGECMLDSTVTAETFDPSVASKHPQQHTHQIFNPPKENP
jgi:hypothetical protein